RSSPSVESGYAFGRLTKGATVRVVEEQIGWARVSMTGDTFNGWWGYVKSTPAVTVENGNIKVGGRAEILAPHAEKGFGPKDSWRQIGYLVAGDTVSILEEVKDDRDTFFKVALDQRSSGWINLSALAPAGGTTPPAKPTNTPQPAPAPTTTEPTTPTTTDTTTTGTATEENSTVDRETGEAIAPTTTDANNGATTTDGTATQTLTVTPTDGAAAGTEQPKTQEAARAAAVEKVKRITFSDLDKIWKKISKEPTETAELIQLRDRYLAFAEDPKTPKGEATNANMRADQIAVRIDVQKSLLEIAELKAKKNAQIDGVADLEKAMWTRQPFDLVGRLNASSVYNGERLPLLYRLQEQGTGQTLAYIIPGPDSGDMSSMLGLLVGVKGQMRYDESLRLNTITPASVDILNAKSGIGSGVVPTTTVSGEKTTGSSTDESK
ncbi:MAG: GW dipeptide domain-containing protein, partial [Planctomycetaceae bacterium]|nr:GW dipeptide domain-containing protein [Planctomycetaceae bacterium]